MSSAIQCMPYCSNVMYILIVLLLTLSSSIWRCHCNPSHYSVRTVIQFGIFGRPENVGFEPPCKLLLPPSLSLSPTSLNSDSDRFTPVFNTNYTTYIITMMLLLEFLRHWNKIPGCKMIFE